MTSISTASVAGLQTAATAAHQRYSDAHASLEAAEAEFGKVAGIRSRLVQRLDEAKRALRDARRLAIEATIAGAGFEEASTRVAAIENEVELLDLSLRRYHSHDHQEAACQSLRAKLNALEAQHRSETARLDHLTAKIQLEISAVAGRNGGNLEIQMGSATAGHRELCNRIRREAEGARLELQTAIAEGRALLDAYEKEVKL